MTTRKRRKKLKLWVITVPFILLLAFFVASPEKSYLLNRWYLLTTGSGRQQINVKKTKVLWNNTFWTSLCRRKTYSLTRA